MKVVFTIIILLSCLWLSATAQSVDTSKASAITRDSLKLLAAARADSANETTRTDSAGAVDPNLKPIEPVKKEAPFVYVDYFPGFRRLNSGLELDSLKQTVLAEIARQNQIRKIVLRNEQVKIAALAKITDLDSLKLALSQTNIDTLRGFLYSRIALKYLAMDNDSLADEKKRLSYENAAVSYSLKSLHEYNSYDDSTGLRESYTNLSTAYNAERKYTEAKWFILQANTVARYQADTANIISTLLALAAIKSEIKDYTLAMGDLDKALQMSIVTHKPQTQLLVLKNFAYLYSVMQNYPKEAMVLKKRDDLLDSIRRAEEAELAKAAALKKRQDALIKKKLYLATLRKTSKASSPAKTASL